MCTLKMSTETSAESDVRERRWGALLLTALLLLFCLRAPWTGSFWLDETISAWIVRGDVQDVVRLSTDFQGQSPFYFVLLWATGLVLGHSEVALRLLSVACGALSLFVLYRLVVDLSHQCVAGFAAVAMLLCSNVFQDALLSARPYALGLLAALLSLLFLRRLTESFSSRNAALFSASCIAAFYAHYLFSVIFIAHGWHLLRTPGLTRRMSGWLLLSGVATLPALPQLYSLFARREGLSFALPLGFRSFMEGAIPVPAVVPAVLGAILGLVWGGRFPNRVRQTQNAAFLLPYIVTPALVFGAASLLGDGSLWVARYWGWQPAAWAALGALLVSSLQGTRGRAVALAATAAFCALRLATQVRHLEDWRGAAAVVSAASGPVALYSGLVEAETMSGAGLPEFEEYIRAPLRVYGISGRIEPLSLRRITDDLQRLDPETEFLIARDRRLGGSSSVSQIEAASVAAGIRLEAVQRERLISVFLVRR